MTKRANLARVSATLSRLWSLRNPTCAGLESINVGILSNERGREWYPWQGEGWYPAGANTREDNHIKFLPLEAVNRVTFKISFKAGSNFNCKPLAFNERVMLL